MQPSSTTVLDNVVWSALTGPQAALGEGGALARRFQQGIAPFAAMPRIDGESLAALASLVPTGQSVAMVGTEELAACPGFDRLLHASLDQMVLGDVAAIVAPTGVAIERLGPTDVPDMLALTAATKPGPFGPRTIELGAYYGIRSQGALVAMAGERLRAPGHCEVSAICVDAQSRGMGYAAALTKHVAAAILARSQTPFLHVLTSNESAIALYRKLGFGLRRQLHLTNFARTA